MLPRYMRGDEAPDEVLLLDEEQRPGLQAPDEQPAQQHRGGGRARHAEREHRQQRADVPAACAAVSGATTPSTRPGAELRAVARHALRHAVAHERRAAWRRRA